MKSWEPVYPVLNAEHDARVTRGLLAWYRDHIAIEQKNRKIYPKGESKTGSPCNLPTYFNRLMSTDAMDVCIFRSASPSKSSSPHVPLSKNFPWSSTLPAASTSMTSLTASLLRNPVVFSPSSLNPTPSLLPAALSIHGHKRHRVSVIGRRSGRRSLIVKSAPDEVSVLDPPPPGDSTSRDGSKSELLPTLKLKLLVSGWCPGKVDISDIRLTGLLEEFNF